MDLGEFSQPLTVCEDPDCRWAHLPEGEHWGRHNRPCAQMFITTGSATVVCVLMEGHDGPHRGDALDGDVG